MMDEDRLVENIAEAMWYLTRESDNPNWLDQDWKWCCKNKKTIAEDLRYRARCAIVKSYIPSPLDTPKEIDLRFKKAFVE